jgi:transcriptional regulator with XRE-family HTH domain
MTFNEVIKKIRQELNITQEQLARDLDVSFSTLNRWENNHNIPSRLARRRLFDYCSEKGVSADTLRSLEYVDI